MSSDKMRAEFEALAKSEGFDLSTWMRVGDDGKLTPTEYADAETRAAEKAYQAGRKAEREAIQREREEWSKAVNKAWIETANTREGQL